MAKLFWFVIFIMMQFKVTTATITRYPFELGKDSSHLNFGIKFTEGQKNFFSDDNWMHSFKIQMPDNHIFTDIGICTTFSRFSLEAGCTLGQSINSLRVNLENELKQVLNTFDQIVPKISINSHSKRALLGFLGKFYGDIFGLATSSQLNKVTHHVNLLIKTMNNVTTTFSNSQGNFESFVKHTSEDFLNFQTFMNDSLAVRQTILDTINDYDDTHKTIEKIILTFTNQAAKIRTHFSNLMVAINLLNNNRISPYLIPYGLLQETLANITNILESEYPNYKLVTTDVSFYYSYDKFLYGKWENNLIITMHFPITTHEVFDFYSIKTFLLPVSPVNLADTNANLLTNPPENLAISNSDQLYTFLTNDFVKSCQHNIHFILCENKLVFQTFETDNCYMELFRGINAHKIAKLCKKESVLERKVLKPQFQILSNSQILICHIAKFNISCHNESEKELDGCIFCIKHIPCGCSIYTEFQRVLSHKTLCQNGSEIETIFPINIPLIQNFFNGTTIDNILKNISLHEPLKINIPKLRVFEQNTKSLIASSVKERLSLEKVANQAKLNKKVYSSLAETLLTGEMPIDSGLKTIDIIAIVGIIVTILNSIVIILICNKLRTLTTVLMLFRTVRGMNTLSYEPVTIKSFDLLKEIENTISYEHVLVFLMVFHILLALMGLYKLDVFKRKRLTTLELHISNGINCIDLRLLIIESCYIEWLINLPPEISIYNIDGVIRPKLHLDTRNLEVKNRITNQILFVPAVINLTYLQAWKIRKLLRTTYFCKIYINHNGKIIQITPNVTDNTVSQINNRGHN